MNTVKRRQSKTKNLNKILAKQIQQHIKGLKTRTKQNLSQECKINLTYENHINKEQKIHGHLNMQRKHLTKSNTLSELIPNKLGMEGNILNLIKDISKKPTTNFTLNDERLKTFPLRSGQDKAVYSYRFHSIVF